METRTEQADHARKVNAAYDKLPKTKMRLKPGLNWGINKQYGHDPEKNPEGPTVKLNARQLNGVEHMFETEEKALVMDVKQAQANAAEAGKVLKAAEKVEAEAKKVAE